MNTKSKRVYELIQAKATSNETVQGISGALGFPFTLIADAGIVFTHYGPMLNEIRGIYGRKKITAEAMEPILVSCKSEILADIVVDKFLGQIPLLGIGANIMCARTMTWRLGLLFAMLSSQGENISPADTVAAAHVIREVFPQGSMFKFRTPSITVVEMLLDSATIDIVKNPDSQMIQI